MGVPSTVRCVFQHDCYSSWSRTSGSRAVREPDHRSSAELSRALKAERFDQALDLYELIEKRKPEEPRWAHRKGDLLRRMGRDAEAVIAYERAVHLYSEKGFDARASATARLLVAIDPSKRDVLDWADSKPRADRAAKPQRIPPELLTAMLVDAIEFGRTRHSGRVLSTALPKKRR